MIPKKFPLNGIMYFSIISNVLNPQGTSGIGLEIYSKICQSPLQFGAESK